MNACGEPLPYPVPRCDLPEGHDGAHASHAMPEHLAEAASQLQMLHDQLETERVAVAAERAIVYSYWKRARLYKRIHLVGIGASCVAVVAGFVAVVYTLPVHM